MSPEATEALTQHAVTPCPRCSQPQLATRPHADAAACIANLRQLLGEGNTLLELRQQECVELRERFDALEAQHVGFHDLVADSRQQEQDDVQQLRERNRVLVDALQRMRRELGEVLR